ncbi:MAG: UDP-N-acetylmuramate--L-alanine ligase [Flavobacteriales bacterium]|nr:UDP-N-acetylmuramate--L-alanine ligase [Flavobacteriales bacterium]
MNLDSIERMYYIGIGGIGMSALAKYFNAKGVEVAGYDLTSSSITLAMEQDQISIVYIDDEDAIPSEFLDKENKDSTLIVYTVAIPQNNRIYNYFLNNGYQLVKRSDVLGAVCNKANKTIAVAGTHGKTTTSSMIAHMLKSANIDCTAFLGGVMQNGEGNLQMGKSDNIIVVEADEYDRSFLTINPSIAVVTSWDHDHVDIYKNRTELESAFNQFANQIKNDGTLIVKEGLTMSVDERIPQFSYGVNSTGDVNAVNIKSKNGGYHFDLKSSQGDIENIEINIGGKHNIENAVAAITVCQMMELNEDEIKDAISNFKGVKRRFEFLISSPQLSFIDDYAHHPAELKAFISSVRELFPGKKLTGIFQPHLYSRTNDLMDEFAEALSLLDEMILLEIYPARELPIEGVTSEVLADKVMVNKKTVVTKQDLLEEIKKGDFEVIMTIGAGDISQLLEPIRLELEYKINNK